MGLLTSLQNAFKLATNKPQKSIPTKEIGTTGVQIYNGMITGEEYLTELSSLSGRVAEYDKMKRSDAQIKATLLSITLPIRQAKWYIDPASDKPEDIEIAEKVQNNLFNGMSITWDDYLRQALSFLWMGFSTFEKVFEFKDGLIQYRKLAPRLQKTLHKWIRDEHGGLGGIQQFAQNNEGKTQYYDIPVDRLVLFVNDQDGSNFEGTSVLRSAYKHWKLKDMLYEIDAIGHDRWASGIPVVTEPETTNPADTARIETILENLHSRTKSWVLLPHGYEMNMFEKQGTNIGLMKSIQHHDEGIAKNVLAQFISLGTTATGSRALGESFEEMFIMSLHAVAGYVADMNNKYVIPQMVDYNWNVKEYPKLKFGNINLKVNKWIESLTGVKNAGIISADLKIENHTRDLLGLPEKSEEEYEEEQEQKKQIQNNIQKSIEKSKIKEEEEELTDYPNGMKLKVYKRSRKLTTLENKAADFDKIEMTLDDGVEKFESQVKRVRKQQVEAVSKQVVKKQPEDIQVPFIGKMTDRLFDEMMKVLKKGKSHVKEDIAYQKKHAEKQLAAKKPIVETVQTFESEADAVAYLKSKAHGDAVRIANSLSNSAIYSFYHIDATKMTQHELIAEIESAIKVVGVREINNIANASINKAYGIGRELQAYDQKNEIEYEVYSCILDSHACQDCLPRDGVRHDIGDPDFVAPNTNHCLGGDRCRCVNIQKSIYMEGEFETVSKKEYAEIKKKDEFVDFEKRRKDVGLK